MNAIVIAASRYGSTTQGAEWIAERLALADLDVAVHRAYDAPSPNGAELVVLGSGLYAHKLLGGLDDYIDRHLDALRQCKLALFALAMRTSPVFVRGQAHGGLAQFQPYFDKLGDALVHADMLGGQMVFSRLTAEDRAGLERFYAMLKLTAAEVKQRKAPRTLMNKADYWAFAEEALRKAGPTS
ncbi:MAG: flavodoxin domain-containing protein [Phycisphaerae bacterium]